MICAAPDDINSELVNIVIPSGVIEGDNVFCFILENIIYDDDVIESTESFLVSIQQTLPPLTIESGSTEVFIEDNDGNYSIQLCTNIIILILQVECYRESLNK